MRTKNVEYPERYRKYLIQQIRSGGIKHDNHIVFATIDDVVQIMRIDTIPLPYRSIEFELNEI